MNTFSAKVEAIKVECRIQEAAIALCTGEGKVSIENHLVGELHHFRKGSVYLSRKGTKV